MNFNRLNQEAKMLPVMSEGMKVLNDKQIPFTVERYGNDRAVGMIRLPKRVTDSLRDCGFRVGHEIFEGESVVFYKGRFFGVTAG